MWQDNIKVLIIFVENVWLSFLQPDKNGKSYGHGLNSNMADINFIFVFLCFDLPPSY